MNNNHYKLEQLQRAWDQNTEDIIQGKIGKYKISHKEFMGRGAFGIVFGGLKMTQQNNEKVVEKVVIKQFKQSQNWKEEDRDKQLIIFDKYSSLFDKKYVLQTVQIFRHKKNSRYLLVMKCAQGGSLSDHYTLFKNDDDIFTFCLRIAEIMRYLHYEVFSGYKPRKKKDGKDSQIVGIIHRDIKPANIVFAVKENIRSAYLIDFGIAKIGYTEQYEKYNSSGTSSYKAVEITQGRNYNAKVDIYSFGCTLYEVLSGGEKLFTTPGLHLQYGDRMRFAHSRFIVLQERLIKQNNLKCVRYWLELLSFLLQPDENKRWTSVQLVEHLEKHRPSVYKDQNPQFFDKLTDREDKHKISRQIYEINFQIFRLNIIQDRIFSIFEYLYFEQPRFNKFLVYLIVKFSSSFIMEKFNRIKYKADKILERKDKFETLKSVIQISKLKELKDKSQGRILKEIEKQKDINKNNTGKTGQIQNFIRLYPEVISNEFFEPRRVLFDICYFKINELLSDPKLAKFIALILLYMQEMDNVAQMAYEIKDVQASNIELLCMKNIMKLKAANENKVSQDKLINLFSQCKIDISMKSDLNREEIKTDIDIQKRK